MKKILKGIITSILLSQIIFLMIPFNIHADQTANTAPFLGFNVQITGYGENMSSIQIPKINFSYAGNTVPSGYISGKLNCTSPSTHTSSAPCDIFSLTNNNGSYSDLAGLKVVFPLQSYLLDSNGNAIINHQSYFFIDYEFILDDSYKGYVTITSSDYVSHTIYVNGNNFHYETFTQDPANPLTFTISDYNLIRNGDKWFFPVESFPWINEIIRNGGVITDINNYLNYYIPSFNFVSGNRIFSGYTYMNYDYYMSFFSNVSLTKGNISTYFDFDTFQVQEVNTLNVFFGFVQYTVKLKSSSNSNKHIDVLQNMKMMPIYFGYNIDILSTDFALNIGVKNDLLKDIDLIANGTTQSNQSASDLQQGTNSMQNQMNSMQQIESGYNQQFNNSLNNIDFSNPIQNNVGILPAANFVITVFNGLVNNPLSILIIIICILTIGKKVIGK